MGGLWKIHHCIETASTNLDARDGVHGDVFTADFQSAGRGRLDHRWLSPPGANLMMSAVLDVSGCEADAVATLPLVVGLGVARATGGMLKWPNDVLAEGRKLAGILCERHGDRVIAGIGVNVRQREFDPEIAARATSLLLLGDGRSVAEVRDAILAELAELHEIWRREGFAAVRDEIAAVDYLRGREIAVMQTDGDRTPVRGVVRGIRSDGALDVGGIAVYAGEAHVLP